MFDFDAVFELAFGLTLSRSTSYVAVEQTTRVGVQCRMLSLALQLCSEGAPNEDVTL